MAAVNLPNPAPVRSLPEIHGDPLLPVPTEYASVDAVRAAVLAHDGGDMYSGALLAERMWWNARVWSVLQTRANGLIATEIRWREARQNRDGRRALAAWRQDYPRMVSTATRRQRAWYGLMLGLALGQRVGEWSPTDGRWILRLQPYWPGWATYRHTQRAYRIRVHEAPAVDVPSPALGGEIDPMLSPWFVYEPNGPYSWRWGLIHPLFYVWYGLDRCVRDGFRFAEKHGIGILKAYFPDTQGDEAKRAENHYVSRLRSIGSEAVIPLKRGQNGADSGQDVQPLEFSGGAGWAGIEGARNGANVDTAVAGLGHNLTTEVKGGSFAAANVGDYIRSDYKEHDALGETAADREQLGRPWALLNFGDPDLAPVGDPETDPPAADQTAAATLASLGQFVAALPEEARARIDMDALFDRFALTLRQQGKARVAGGVDAEDAAIAAPERAADDEAPADAAPQQENVALQQGGKVTERIAIPLTPTDLAAIASVDEGRASIGLEPIGGDIGDRWIVEHATLVRAETAPELAEVASAEQGREPGKDDDADSV